MAISKEEMNKTLYGPAMDGLPPELAKKLDDLIKKEKSLGEALDDRKIDLSINPELSEDKEFMDDLYNLIIKKYGKYAK